MDHESSFKPDTSQALPLFFRHLASMGCLTAEAIQGTQDHFYAARKSIADILIGRGITTFSNDQDQTRECGKFFDDWYLYAVPGGKGYVYSLFKMREQEHNAEKGEIGDGDTPGVTVSFIAFDTGVLSACLTDPSHATRKALHRAFNRVVAARQPRHEPSRKTGFSPSPRPTRPSTGKTAPGGSPGSWRKTTPLPATQSATTNFCFSGIPEISPSKSSWRFWQPTPPMSAFLPSRRRFSTMPGFWFGMPGSPFPFWVIPSTTAPSGRI